MRLESFEVTKYRNVVHSGSIDVDADVTCLVGKNEAGKSAILSALHRANPADSAAFNVQDEYPRWLLVADRRADGDLGAAAPIRATLRLEDDDRAAIDALVGPGVMTGERVVLSRSYNGAIDCTTGPLDEARAVSTVLDAFKADLRLAPLFGSRSFAELRAATASAREDATETLRDRIDELEHAIYALLGDRDLHEVVREALIERLPIFFYFDNYSLLPGRIDLEALAGDLTPGSLRTTRALLRLAGAQASLLASEDYELRRAELEAVSSELTAQVLEYWTQSSELDVSIDVDVQIATGHEHETQTKRFLDIRVHDKRHGYTGNFAQRSTGFQWFFSFLAAFSDLGAVDRRVIVLLDEPALGLHAHAQHDFLRFINERLAPRSQVIYTTHSPFMIENGRLERVRVVEDHGPPVGAIITDHSTGASPDSTLPIATALAHDVAQDLAGASANLLVDGATAFTYLTVLSEHLKARGRRGLDDRWNVIPTAGATSIAAFATLGGDHSELRVLVDASAASAETVERLCHRGLVDRRRIVEVRDITQTEGATIEDLFAPADYLLLVNPALGEHHAADELPPGERIVDRLVALRSASFDSALPAEYLLRQRHTLLPLLSETTLARYEQLCARLNGAAAAPVDAASSTDSAAFEARGPAEAQREPEGTLDGVADRGSAPGEVSITW